MKTFKIILLCIIPILGIYGMNKIQFGEKLVIMLPGKAPVRRPGPPPGSPPGPPPQMEQEGPQAAVPGGEHEAGPVQETEQGRPQASVSHGEGEQISQGPPAGPPEEEISKWKIRINFNRGIKNMGYLTLIMAFLVELTYIADRLIRRKSLL